ncbi:hypothetical protein [Brevundimonas sp.]
MLLIEETMCAESDRLMGAGLKTLAEGLAAAWLDAKMADMVWS